MSSTTIPGQEPSHQRAPGTRERILDAASQMMDAAGLDAVSTRAIAAAAGVQPPAIYRIFGDKQGLLDALARHQFEQHLLDKRSLQASGDPVADLRAGWDQHVQFGLDHPQLYAMVYGNPQPGNLSSAAEAANELLRGYIHRVALAGRLAVDEERAALVMHAAGRGVTLTLLGQDPADRDPDVSLLAREAVLARITTNAPEGTGTEDPGLAEAAVSLAARLDDATALTPAERALLGEWLHRLATTAP